MSAQQAARALNSLAGRPRTHYVQKPRETSLAEILASRREMMRTGKWSPVGKMHAIRFDLNANAAYKKLENQEHPFGRMLMFQWPEAIAPVIGDAGGNQYLFPFGMELPTEMGVASVIETDPARHKQKVKLDLLDLADGEFMGRDGTHFIVIQPVICFVTIYAATMVRFMSENDAINGTRPALLYCKRTKEAHFVRGVIAPDKCA